MSDFSRTFIQILSTIVLTAVRDQEECSEEVITEMAQLLDQVIGGKVETVPSVEKKILDKSEKYTSANVPVGKCPFILTRAPNTGKCCSLNVKEGSSYCTRHSKAVSEGGDTAKVTKSSKIVNKTAQESVEVPKPEMKFNIAARNFKPMVAKTPDTTESDKPKVGIFVAKTTTKATHTLFSNKKKANFYSRMYQAPDDGDEVPEPMMFFFTDDLKGKNMIFIDEDGIRSLAGIIDEELNIDEKDEPLPPDFLEHVNSDVSDITDEQREWCTKNKISIPA